MQQYWNRRRECRLHDGAEALVRDVASVDVAQVIISAAETSLVLDGLAHFNVSGLYKLVRGLDHHFASSIESIVVKFVQSIDVSPAEVVFIGDTLHDFEVARQAGLDCILFAGGHHPRSRLRACGVPVFDSFQDIRSFLFQNGGA